MLRSQDKLPKLVQRFTASAYLSEFRNIILTIPGNEEGEKLDRFCEGLKPQVSLEVQKSVNTTLGNAAGIALTVDSTLYGSEYFSFQRYGSYNLRPIPNGPHPMEIGNMEYNCKSTKQRFQHKKSNTCYICSKVGCRSWKHHLNGQSNEKRKSLGMNNMAVEAYSGPSAVGARLGN